MKWRASAAGELPQIQQHYPKSNLANWDGSPNDSTLKFRQDFGPINHVLVEPSPTRSVMKQRAFKNEPNILCMCIPLPSEHSLTGQSGSVPQSPSPYALLTRQ